MILKILIYGALLILSAIWLYKRRKMSSTFNQIPRPKGNFIFGNILDFNVPSEEIFQILIKYCKFNATESLVGGWIFHKPYVLIFKASSAEVILRSQKHIGKSNEYAFLQSWLGTGLLTSNGQKWHSRRKLLTPAFHFSILEDFLDVINKNGSHLVEVLQPLANGEQFDIHPIITRTTLNVIIETAMGTDISKRGKEGEDYVKTINCMGKEVQRVWKQPWLQIKFIYWLTGGMKILNKNLEILHGFTNKTIADRKAERAENIELNLKKSKKRLSFLDLLLECSEKGKILTDEDIREEVDTFMFEGHDTTAAAVNYSLYLIGENKDAQLKCQQELDEIFKNSDRVANMNDLKEMQYLESCIKEAMRIFPPVPIIAREVTENIHTDGYTIPQGSTILLYIYMIHRDPKYFPDPEKFIPERFLNEVINRNPFSYVPFSAGTRNCIGQKFAMLELKILVSSVLRNFNIESCIDRKDIKLMAEIILRTPTGNLLKLTKRQN